MAHARAGKNASEISRHARWRPFVIIIAAAALAHIWCLGSQFFLDDYTPFLNSPELREGDFRLVSKLSWTHLCYFIQYKLFGFSPVAVHAVNWLLHTAIACTLFALGRDLVRGESPEGVALFGAVLFAVHPLASEIPNYARTQDLAWVTLFSLLATWSLLRFLQRGGRVKLVWCMLAIAGAAMSKGPGLFHALMMTCAVGLVYMTADHWRSFRRRGWWLAFAVIMAFAVFWYAGSPGFIRRAISLMEEPRFIGHGYTLARVFWEFAWRAVIPVSLSADHHIAETLIPPGSRIWNIPDKVAMLAAVSMLALTAFSIFLAWRKNTRLVGVCLFLFTGTILFRVLYLIPEFMPEYRIYPGMPWFCLGAALVLASAWKWLFRGLSPQAPAALLCALLALLSARRSFQWHDLDHLMADVLRQYPAQGRAIWELHLRDAHAGEWGKIIARHRTEWPQIFRLFLEENRRLAPARELSTGHFALAEVASTGLYAEALAHMEGSAPAMAEIRRLENHMLALQIDPVGNRTIWNHFHRAKAKVLEHAGRHQAAYALMQEVGTEHFIQTDVRRVKAKAMAAGADE